MTAAARRLCEGGCSRWLTDPASIRVGYGPVCAVKAGLPHPHTTTVRRSAPADQPTLEDHMPLTAAQWNDRYPVGTPVIAYPGTRPKDDPDATRLVARTRSEAQVLGDHTDVVWVDGHPACISLSHVDPIDPEQVARAMAEVNRTLIDFRAAIGPAVQRAVANLVRVAEAVQAAMAAQPGAFALAPPAEVEPDDEPAVVTRPCGHDDYHVPHEWADRPGTWCPGHTP